MDRKTGIYLSTMSFSNPISVVMELSAGKRAKISVPENRETDESIGFGHIVIVKFINKDGDNDEIEGVGSDRSRKLAKQEAYVDALAQLFPAGKRGPCIACGPQHNAGSSLVVAQVQVEDHSEVSSLDASTASEKGLSTSMTTPTTSRTSSPKPVYVSPLQAPVAVVSCTTNTEVAMISDFPQQIGTSAPQMSRIFESLAMGYLAGFSNSKPKIMEKGSLCEL